jgi:integrase
MRAWLFQDSTQKKKRGVKAPWSVGWYQPDGKKRSKRIGSKSQAEKFRRKREGELAAGTYRSVTKTKWSEFRKEYERTILPRLARSTQKLVKTGLDHFERIVKPQRVGDVKTQTIDEYVAVRRIERGLKRGSTISPGTVNRELRHLKSVLNIAKEWGYLSNPFRVRFLRESEEIGRVFSEQDFQTVFAYCDSAVRPIGLHCTAGEWWQALLAFAITTGWRIDEILSFRRDDLDLETGAILTRAANNKGKRDDADYLPEATLGHVRAVVGFHPLVFAWPHSQREVWNEFHRIQRVAGIHLTCPHEDDHECTDTCHVYGFHALRRAYATLNVDVLPAAVLQRKMRHRSFTTTLRYIEVANKMKRSAENVHVPEVLKRKQT